MKTKIYRSCLSKITLAATLAGAGVSSNIAAAADTLSDFSTRPALFASPDLATSTFQAGYRTKPRANPISDGSTTFTVPDIDCGASTEGITLGIGHVKNPGKPQVLGEVWVACSGGNPFYRLSALVGTSSDTSSSVSVGDTIRVQITQGGASVTAEVTDTTSGEVVTATGFPKSDDQLVFGAFPLFSGGTMAGVPDFGSVEFTSGKLNGKKLRKRVNAVQRTNGATVQISVGPLVNGSFTLTFQNH